MGEELYKEHLKNILQGVNIAELAEKTGLSKITLYSIKKGNSTPSQSTYKNICAALGIDGMKDDELISSLKALQTKLTEGTYIIFTRDSIFKIKGSLNKLC